MSEPTSFLRTKGGNPELEQITFRKTQYALLALLRALGVQVYGLLPEDAAAAAAAFLPIVPKPGSVSTTSGILTAGGDVLTANAARIEVTVQNLGTNPIYVRKGTGASASNFDFALSGGSVNDDGKGGFASFEWIGDVSVAGTSPRFVVTSVE